MSDNATSINDSARARPYHHGDLKQTLTDAACRHIADGGTEKLSLRALAREAGVSPTAPYRHFPTKNCLFAAIAAEGFCELRRQIDEFITRGNGEPAAELLALGKAYISYAAHEPVKFNLMFGDVLADFSAYEELQKNAEQTFARVAYQVEKAKKADIIDDIPVEEVTAYLWSSIHGVASLLNNKQRRLEHDDQSAAVATIRFLSLNTELMLSRIIRGVLKAPQTL